MTSNAALQRIGEIQARASQQGVKLTDLTAMHADVPKLCEAALRALALHRPSTPDAADPVCSSCMSQETFDEPADWPCATVRAITEALGE